MACRLLVHGGCADWIRDACALGLRSAKVSVEKGAYIVRRLCTGLTQPLPEPVRPWSSGVMDFVTGLPESDRGRDSILVCAERC
jgi:hypothetical protein